MKNKLLFAITTYNDLEYTKICLDSLKEVKDIDLDIIIIDDYSDDDTVNWCKSNGYKVLERPKPLGLTYSWNEAYKYFKSNNYKYLVISNSDVVIPNNSLSELAKVLDKYPSSTVVPMSTKKGVGHNPVQDIGNFFPDLKGLSENPNSYQMVQDSLLSMKEKLKSTKDLYMIDPFRMKHFNGFFFMFNRNVTNYEHKDGWIFNPKNIMTKNEDDFNWQSLLPNNDNAWVCRTSFIYHFKDMSCQNTKLKDVGESEQDFLNERNRLTQNINK